MLEAILLSRSIRLVGNLNCRFDITHRLLNGVVIGHHDDEYVALTVDTLAGSLARHPVIGGFSLLPSTAISWILGLHAEVDPLCLDTWIKQLQDTPRLKWLARLRRHINIVPMVKLAIEGYNAAEIPVLGRAGWFVGWSAANPERRIYALIPEWELDRGEPHLLAGKMRRIQQFGHIMYPNPAAMPELCNISPEYYVEGEST